MCTANVLVSSGLHNCRIQIEVRPSVESTWEMERALKECVEMAAEQGLSQVRCVFVCVCLCVCVCVCVYLCRYICVFVCACGDGS